MAGAGKSTQCQLLATRENFQWFSVGKHLRSIETGEARAEMMHGKVLDDRIVTPIVEAELSRIGDSPEILLDGCPRTVGQAEWLSEGKTTPKVRCVIHLMVDDTVALARLLSRGREDDSEEAMKIRFAGYHRDIYPVLGQFTKRDIPVIEIDGDAEQEAVYAKIKAALDEL